MSSRRSRFADALLSRLRDYLLRPSVRIKIMVTAQPVIARSVFCDEAIPALQFQNDHVGDCFAKTARNDRRGEQLQIMGIVLALVLILGFGVTWQARVAMTRALLDQLHKRGISIARDIAARSADYILINHTYALHELLQDSLRNNADLRYAFILDANNRVLVHTFENGMPRGLVEKNSVAPTARPQRRFVQR